jgi:tetratricopeptide (TPR) repeat protein
VDAESKAPDLVTPAIGSAPTALRQIPPHASGMTRFTGRGTEIAALSELLHQAARGTSADDALAVRTAAVAAITGSAGVGKTALAVHWAQEVAAEFPGGQLYADLRGFDPAQPPADPAAVLTGCLRALGVEPEDIPAALPARAELLGGLLADRRVLLLLDNALDDEQVRPLLPGAPGSLVILTSRSDLTGLAGAQVLALDVLTEAEARDLLDGILGSARLAGQPDAAGEFVRLCAGLPLALVIAAAQAHARPRQAVTALAAELRDAAARPGVPAGPLTPNIQAVISWSVSSLSAPAAAMFSLLGVHPGPDITAPAAASLAGVPLPRGLELLGELAGSRLLTEHFPGRYALHDMIRAYAAEQAAGLDDQSRSAALTRALDHYLHTAHAAALLLNASREPIPLGPPADGVAPEQLADHGEAQAWLQAERAVLLSAVTLAGAAGFDAHAWKLSWTMSDFLDWRGYWIDWSAINHIALAAATRLGDVTGQAAISRLLAHSYARAGDYETARSYLTECLGLCRNSDNRVLAARVYLTLCAVSFQEGRYVDMLGAAEQSLALFRAIGDRAGEAHSLNNVGYAHMWLGNPRLARMFCKQSLAMHQENNLREGEANTLDSLAQTEYHLGRYPEAIAYYLRSIELFHQVGHRYQEALALVSLGDVQHASGDRDQAQDSWRQAITILDGLHHPAVAGVRNRLRGA